MLLEEFISKFSRLNTDRGKHRWSADTCHRAPHKPFHAAKPLSFKIYRNFKSNVVEAAHIVPWSESQDDQPTNGLCLCRICHWSFDEGLMSVGKKYEVLVSKRVQSDRNMPGHIQTLMERPIFRPELEVYWPGQVNLSKHRQKVFS